MPNSEKLLAIYLNDHLAGATAGVELARRLRASNRDEPFAQALEDLCAEIETDYSSLESAMERLGVPRGKLKPAAAWAGEKLGRLKPNGQARGYSPLSRVLELEILTIGITGKLRLWAALDRSRGDQGIDFKRLAERARQQRDKVEELHREAVTLAFG